MRDKDKIVFWIFVVLMFAIIILFICSASATQVFLSKGITPIETNCYFIPPFQFVCDGQVANKFQDMFQSQPDTIGIKKFQPTVLSIFVIGEELENRDVKVYAYIESYEGYLYYLYNDEWIFAKNQFDFKPATEGILPQWIWNPSWVVFPITDVRSFTVHVCVDDKGYRVCAEKKILVSVW